MLNAADEAQRRGRGRNQTWKGESTFQTCSSASDTQRIYGKGDFLKHPLLNSRKTEKLRNNMTLSSIAVRPLTLSREHSGRLLQGWLVIIQVYAGSLLFRYMLSLSSTTLCKMEGPIYREEQAALFTSVKTVQCRRGGTLELYSFSETHQQSLSGQLSCCCASTWNHSTVLPCRVVLKIQDQKICGTETNTL